MEIIGLLPQSRSNREIANDLVEGTSRTTSPESSPSGTRPTACRPSTWPAGINLSDAASVCVDPPQPIAAADALIR
jgi:hypothetical protein